ncbi:MAG TPA: hypothetical protein VE222_07990 [Nitrospiraceae bacterium]|nr:hypothetical protein [Nitrospiraceae bacterium]
MMPQGVVMDWRWIVMALTIPTAIGLLVALPIWWKAKEPIFGAIAGAFPIGVAVVVLIGREYIELERYNQACHFLLEQHIVCSAPSPEAFTRFGIYCFIGMVETGLLFMLSQSVETRRQRQQFEGAWRDLKY